MTNQRVGRVVAGATLAGLAPLTPFLGLFVGDFLGRRLGDMEKWDDITWAWYCFFLGIPVGVLIGLIGMLIAVGIPVQDRE